MAQFGRALRSGRRGRGFESRRFDKKSAVFPYGTFFNSGRLHGGLPGGEYYMKTLFFDIDGTILSEVTGNIPESTRKALQQTKEKGNLTFLNTGRTWSELSEELRRLPCSGFLCGCGTYLRLGNEILLHRAIPEKECAEISCFLIDKCADMILEGTEDIYFPSWTSRFEGLEKTRRSFGRNGVGVQKSAETPGIVYDKFLFYTDGQTELSPLLQKFSEDYEVMDRRGGIYEAVPRGYSKGTAVHFALNYFALSLQDAYVFGDSSNDLAMFQCGAHTIAMGEHDPVLDPYTEYVTDLVEEDGIQKALEHFGLL